MVLYNLGDIDLRSGAPEQAADHLARSFAYDSSRWESYNNLGFALVQARRPAEAVALLGRTTSRLAGAATALALASMDRDREALAQLDRAPARDPELASARGLRTRIRPRLGDRTRALADWQRCVLSQPAPDPAERVEVEHELAERGVTPPRRALPASRASGRASPRSPPAA